MKPGFSKWNIILILAVLLISGCTSGLGRYSCEDHDCYGQNLWQRAIDKIAAANQLERPLKGKVFADPQKNAWVTDEGTVNITSDLMLRLDQRGDVYILSAAAHEIGHILARHNDQKSKAAANIKLLRVEESGHLLEGDQAFAALSRQQEIEADQMAVRYLENLGYGAEDYLKFLEWMKKNLQDIPKSALASHPSTQTRMEYIRKMIR